MQTVDRIELGLDIPTGLLEEINPLTDFDYVLVDKALKDSKYLNYFRKSKRRKMLNNRLMGTDSPVPLDGIRKIWDILGGEVISPDWGNDHLRTLRAYEECCKTFGEESIIGVIQGDVEECLRLYGKKVAVGFDVGSTHEEKEGVKVGRRVLVVHSIRDRKVHLLGLTNPYELYLYKEYNFIYSLNTGLPIYLASIGRTLFPYSSRVKDISSYNYMNMNNPLLDINLVEKNINLLRGALDAII